MDQVTLGSKRNYLLVKDDVGKSKPTTRKLPSEQFSYGRPDHKDCESAAAGKELLLIEASSKRFI
jgi:hypothetical protein